MTLREEIKQLRAENSDLSAEVEHLSERAQLLTVALVEISDRVTEAEALLDRHARVNPAGWSHPWPQVFDLIQSAENYALPAGLVSPEVASLLEQRKALRAAPLRFHASFRDEHLKRANDLIKHIQLRLEKA